MIHLELKANDPYNENVWFQKIGPDVLLGQGVQNLHTLAGSPHQFTLTVTDPNAEFENLDPSNIEQYERFANAGELEATAAALRARGEGATDDAQAVIRAVTVELCQDSGLLDHDVKYYRELRVAPNPQVSGWVTLVEYVQDGSTTPAVAWLDQAGHGDLRGSATWAEALEAVVEQADGFEWSA